MAVMTYTRRHIVDMLPEFLTKRLRGFEPLAEGLAKESGVSREALGVLNGALAWRDGERLRRETVRWRSPYAIKREFFERAMAELVAAGYAETTEDGWRAPPRGLEIAVEASRRIGTYLRSLSMPPDATRRSAVALDRLASRIPPEADRSALVRRVRPVDEPPSDLVTMSLAANELWAFRDDCHIPAWQAAGYEGPTFDVLSYIWSSPADMQWTKIGGHATITDLAKALAARQDRSDVERNLDLLAKRGDVQRDGDVVRITWRGQRARDAIEEETDRRYFAIWDLDDAATARLGDDLRTVIDALPKA